MDEALEKGSRFSRRKFLKEALKGAATASLLSSTGPLFRECGRSSPIQETKPEKIEGRPSVLIVDLFGSEEAMRDQVDQLIKTKAMEKRGIASPSSMAEALETLGLKEEPTSLKELRQAIYPPYDEVLALAHLSQALIIQYQGHGEKMENALPEITRELGYKGKNWELVGGTVSVAKFWQFEGISYDPLGNPRLTIRLPPERISPLIEQSPDAVVNLSLEAESSVEYLLYKKEKGDADWLSRISFSPRVFKEGEEKDKRKIFLQEEQGKREISVSDYLRFLAQDHEGPVQIRPFTERDFFFYDAYSPYPDNNQGRVFLNLFQMVRLAWRHPNKFFVIAGGNPPAERLDAFPDIHQVRESLETLEIWPNNLLVAGVIASIAGFRGAWPTGADIYVEEETLRSLELSPTSSYATLVVSSLVRRMIAKGINDPNKIRRQVTEKYILKGEGKLPTLDWEKARGLKGRRIIL